MSPPHIWGLVAGFLAAVAATAVVERVARRNALYRRLSARDAHARPTPRLGGLAIAAGVLVALLIPGSAGATGGALVVVAGATALLTVGAWDDLTPLPAVTKLLAQAVVAAATVLAIQPRIAIDLTFVVFEVDGVLAAIVGVVWIVGFVNALNFMDGIDGIAAGAATAAIPGLVLVLNAPPLSYLLLALAGACLGFLVWNHHPATIFMGDSGSYFIGFLVAASVLLPEVEPAPLIPMLVIFSLFLLDVAVTLVRRARDGQRLMAPHADHLYQRLVRAGHGQRAVMSAYVGATALGGIAGAAHALGDLGVKTLVVLGVAAMGAGYLAIHLSLRRTHGDVGREGTRG